MPKFSYTVKNAAGKTINGTDDAANQDVLVSRLQQKGYFVAHVEPFLQAGQRRQAQPAHTRRFTHTKVKLDDLLLFAHQLRTLLNSGVTLLRALTVISAQIESKQFSGVIEQVKKDVERGNSLSASLAKHPKVFNQFWVSLIEVGEASGTMPTVLKKLAFYLDQEAAFRASIISAIIYPAILLCVAIGAILFFALSVGPRFKSIFDSFGVKLPVLTTVLLSVFDFIKAKFLVIILLAGAILLTVKAYIQTPAGRNRAEALMLRLPTFGSIYRIIIVERFTSQMSILVDSGVPILYALDITQRMVGNVTCAGIINDVKNDVREGKLLAEPMTASGFFPPMAVQMILIGEETGELAQMLRQVAEYYQSYVQVFMKRFGVIIEPVMLIFMGVVIGTIVIAMFMPIFNIAQIGGV